jgi:hypothetical protein
VGIDWYPPISNWRDGTHLDAAEARSVYDRDYLADCLASGEASDWYYADAADRAAQMRSPITDGAYGKPWVFRPKDLVAWWSNAHVERVGGFETAASPWVPQSKPIWLTEVGIPAVDKGTNGPNVFPDPKSSESAYPPHSVGVREDLMQVRGLEALLGRFDPAEEGFEDARNPVSSVYRAHGRSGPGQRLGLGRAPVSGLSRSRERVVGRRKLADRSLDYRAARGRGHRPAHWSGARGVRARRTCAG